MAGRGEGGGQITVRTYFESHILIAGTQVCDVPLHEYADAHVQLETVCVRVCTYCFVKLDTDVPFMTTRVIRPRIGSFPPGSAA